ncbi:MAG: tetratricopeptide repeat protein [Fibrobacterota bacterium]
MNARQFFSSTVLISIVAAGNVLAAPAPGSNHPDCVSQKKAEEAKGGLLEQVNKINEQGREKKAECLSMEGAKQQRCLDQLKPLREQVAALNAKIAPINDDIQKYKALCPTSSEETAKTRELYEKVAKDNCNNPKGDPKRCEDALFNIADIDYQIDQRNNLGSREKYEREYDKWKANDKRGKEPTQALPSFAKGLSGHQRYLKEIPEGGRRDVILYRTAFIYDLMGRSTEAFPLLMEISRKFPQSRQIGPANLRIGEFYFVDKKYDSAIVYYNKVDPNAPGSEAVLGLALYHKAEALYQKAKYQVAVDAFFDYVERADKGQIRGDLRSEAILYMGSCFAEFPDSYKDAKKYFGQRGHRAYEDTLFYELAIKHADRDQHDLAIPALEYFLKTYSDYYKAPLAQIKVVEVWDKKKKIEEAQEAREQLVQKFGRTSAWWQKPRKIDRKELEQIQIRVRDVMLEVAMQLHFPGKERKDTNMVKKAVASYQRFVDQYATEGNWPIYRAKIYLADALSFIRQHEQAADVYLWASAENVNDPKKYREPTIAERKLTQPVDAGYNAVAELQLAASDEVAKQGGDKVKAYNQPITKRYMASVESYLNKFPKATDAPDLTYNLFLFQVNGQDWTNAINTGNRMIKSYPTYKYATDTRARMAFAYTQSGRFMEAEKEYRNVLGALPKGDTLLAAMTNNIGEVIWRMAENAEKAGKVDSAVYNFRRLAKEYPSLSIADSAAFRAAVALENGKRPREAALEYSSFERTYRGKSGLCIMAIQAAADQYRQAKDTVSGVAILLDSLFRYYPNTPDSAAFKGISQAASLYEGAGRNADKAKTLEIYYTRYPKHEQTPAFLYTAGLSYEKAKLWGEAVRVYKLVIGQFPKHQYAPEAAFSVPIIEEKQGNKAKMAEAYELFATQYPTDKSKVSKAYLRAASYYDSTKNVKKADELYGKLVAYYKEGQNAVTIDASIPAEAYYKMGMIRSDSANAIKLGGTTDIKKIAEAIKARAEAYKKANEYFDNSIKLLIEEWTIKSASQEADNEMKLLTDTRAIEAPQGNNLKAIQERIMFRVGVAKGIIPTLSAKTAKQYESFLALTRKAGIQNEVTKAAGQSILRTYYFTGAGFELIGAAILEEPCPSKAKQGSDQYNEECEYHKAQKEDNMISFQKLSVDKGYVPGVEKAAEMGIVGPILDSLKERIKFIAPDNAVLGTQVVEKQVEVVTQSKVDKDLERALSRIDDISEGDLDQEEKVRALKAIKIEGERTEQDLRTAIQELKAKSKRN